MYLTSIYDLSTNCGIQLFVLRKQCIVRIASSQTAICSIDATADRLDLFFHFEINNLLSRKFFLPSSRKLLFAISDPIELIFYYF